MTMKTTNGTSTTPNAGAARTRRLPAGQAQKAEGMEMNANELLAHITQRSAAIAASAELQDGIPIVPAVAEAATGPARVTREMRCHDDLNWARAQSYLEGRRCAAQMRREAAELARKPWGANLASVAAHLAACAEDRAQCFEATPPTWARFLFEVRNASGDREGEQ